MKTLFKLLNAVILLIVIVVFAAGVFITGLGLYDFTHAFSFFSHAGEEGSVQIAAISVLKAVDLFLMAIVLFVFSVGLLSLFSSRTDAELPSGVPVWLKVKSFIELKVTLWEAILTTMVIGYLGYLVELRLQDKAFVPSDLTIPAGILLIAVSLYFLKKGDH